MGLRPLLTQRHSYALFNRLFRAAKSLLVIGLFVACSPYHDAPPDSGAQKDLYKLLKPNYQSLHQIVFKPQCLRCHDEPTSRNHNIDLSSYESVMNSSVFPPLVVPGQPHQSSLYLSVLHQKMPKEAPPLPQTVTSVIAEWIRLGAPKTATEDSQPDPCEEDGSECEDETPPDCAPGEPGCEDEDQPEECLPGEPGCGEDEAPDCHPSEPGCEDDEPVCAPDEPGCF